jgi:hypothetical protein
MGILLEPTCVALVHRPPLDKKHLFLPAFSERLVEDVKGEILNEHQQDNENFGECLLESATE